MAANITDLIDRVSDSSTGRPVISTLAAPGKALAASSINLTAATNWTTTTAIHFSIYETTTVGSTVVKDASTQTDWKGTLSGTTVSSLTLTGGTDRAYTAGAIVELTPTARYAKDLYDWASTQHNPDGTHKGITTDTLTVTGGLTLAAGSVETADLAAAAVTSAKVNFGGAGAGIWWEEIGRTTLSSTGNSISVTGLPARKYLKVIYSIINSGSVGSSFRFNNDAGSNYGWRKSISGATDTSAAPVSQLAADSGGNSFPIHGDLEIINILAQEKVMAGMIFPQAGAGSATAPVRIEFAGKWVNTSSQINRIDVLNLDTGQYAIGSELIVLGHN